MNTELLREFMLPVNATPKRLGRPPKAPQDKASTSLRFRMTESRRAIYERAARIADKTVTEWALYNLDRAAIRCEVCSGILSDHVGGVPCNARKPGADE